MAETATDLVRSWLTKAGNDLICARILGDTPEAPLDIAIYHCQQAGEKAVKAFLVHCGITPPKTHDLRKLVLEAASRDSSFSRMIDIAASLTPYAWEFRYPDDLAETYPTREEFAEALANAQELYAFVALLLPGTLRTRPEKPSG